MCFSPHILGTVHRVESMAACAWDTGALALQWYSEVPCVVWSWRQDRQALVRGSERPTTHMHNGETTLRVHSSGEYFPHVWKEEATFWSILWKDCNLYTSGDRLVVFQPGLISKLLQKQGETSGCFSLAFFHRNPMSVKLTTKITFQWFYYPYLGFDTYFYGIIVQCWQISKRVR